VIGARESLAPTGATRVPRRGRLLVVDDEPGVLRVLKLILGRHHDVFTEGLGDVALRRILGGEHFDLIFSDLMMPEMTGMELLAELRRAAPDQADRLVFLTGGAVTPAAQEFLATTTHDLIVKPFDVNEILAFVFRRLADSAPVS
jgi:CheY-like chemotaxis protein